jgi:penicillin-binding protein 1A
VAVVPGGISNAAAMDVILVKIFATALALSEVVTQPRAVETHFDAVADQAQVAQLLHAGCDHMRQAFDIESINLDDLIATALDDPKAMGAGSRVFRGINLADLQSAYRQFCTGEGGLNPTFDLGQVIDYFNKAAADLPDPMQLKGRNLPSMSVVLDSHGQTYADVFQSGNRRIWIRLNEVPEPVQKAFISAEDRHFLQHNGVDERGIIRAFIGNLGDTRRPQGGSTITQQVVKNLLVGDAVTYDRKIREMIVATRLEATLSKDEILGLYLNSVYFGRGAWGVEMAARTYFGKSAKDLTLAEGALLAGLVKGPSYFDPDHHPDRAKARLTYVLNRMQEDGIISVAEKEAASADLPKLASFDRRSRDSGFQFIDYLGREARADGIQSLTAQSYTVHSTISPQLQRDAESALQEGLAHYELSAGRVHFNGPEANLADAIQKLAADSTTDGPPWQAALRAAHLPLYDVHWTPAVILRKDSTTTQVGLRDGRIAPLVGASGAIRRQLSLFDVIYVKVVNGMESGDNADTRPSHRKKAPSPYAELRVRPTAQGAALVLENKTGRILAMVGSFSYPLSQLNRTWQTQRQPGSAVKPVTYLTALQKGLQPNTLVPDVPITLPPIGAKYNAKEEDYWSPRNADNSSGGTYTLRRGLENSRNLITAHLLDGGINDKPDKSLDAVCRTALDAKIYTTCVRYYPFILGAQPVRMIDLAAFYAAIANEGARPQPHAIDSIELDGSIIYNYPYASGFPMIAAADRASFFQLKTILQGVVARGTARAISELSPYVAGKTGTTEDAVDGWFVGFTNDVTVAVWVGYDNGDGKRRSLGSSETGAAVALPIFKPIIQAIWREQIAPKLPLSGPSPEARKDLVARTIDYESGVKARTGFTEYFRRDSDGRVVDTQYKILGRASTQSARASSRKREAIGVNNDTQRNQWGFPSWQQGQWQPWSQNSANTWNNKW